jgi:uncharacterized OB-fold protein
VARPIHEGLFTVAGDGELHLLGGFSPTSGRFHFPRLATCPYSGAGDVEPVELSARGTLWGHTAVTVAPPGYRGTVPYGFGIVELTAERLRVVGRITEPDPARLAHGQPMQVVAETVFTDDDGDEVVTWAFAPVEEEGA